MPSFLAAAVMLPFVAASAWAISLLSVSCRSSGLVFSPSDPCFDQQEQRTNDQEKELAWTLICVWRPCRKRSTPDRPLESFGISRSAAAIPGRTDLICTRTVPANLLQTPRRAQSCRLFAGSSRAQSTAEHFRDETLIPLQIRFERGLVNLLRKLLHLLESSIRRHLHGRKMARPGAPAELLFHHSCAETSTDRH